MSKRRRFLFLAWAVISVIGMIIIPMAVSSKSNIPLGTEPEIVREALVKVRPLKDNETFEFISTDKNSFVRHYKDNQGKKTREEFNKKELKSLMSLEEYSKLNSALEQREFLVSVYPLVILGFMMVLIGIGFFPNKKVNVNNNDK